MRVRAHIDAVTGCEFGRAHLIEEDERANHALFRIGQDASNLETAEIPCPTREFAYVRIGHDVASD
jgi:hypothetical protein